MSAPLALLAALTLAAAGAHTVARAVAVPPAPDPAARAALRAADSLLARGQAPAALRVSDSLARALPRDADPRLRARVLTLLAGARTLTGRADLGEAPARGAMALGAAAGDSAIARVALRWLAFTLLSRGRLAEATPLYRRLLAEAGPHDEHLNVGYAHMGIAYDALLGQRNDEARRHYQRSIEAMRRAGDRRAERDATVGLARVHMQTGDFDAVRRLYGGLLGDAQRAGDRRTEAEVRNNLGVLEYEYGDPARAAEHWRAALALHQGDRPESAASTHLNALLAVAALGRIEEAEAGADSVRTWCRERGLRLHELRALELALGLAGARRRFERAESLAARAVALADSVPLDAGIQSLFEVARVREAAGHPAEALALLERRLGPQRARLDERSRAEYDMLLGRFEAACGRPAAALAHLRRAAPPDAPPAARPVLLTALEHQARAWRVLGRGDSALAALERATASWESRRRAASDPEWRAASGAAGVRIYGLLAALLLDPAGPAPATPAAAFARLQRFKARTLLERVVGPGRDPGEGSEGVIATRLQDALSEGEVFVDTFLGADTAFAFAVDRHGVAVGALPGPPALVERVRLYLDLTRTPGDARREALRARAAAALGAALFPPPIAEAVRRARTVIVSPDGVLNLVPFGTLALPGDGGRALADTRAVCRVPSAALLVVTRERPAAPRGHGVLALAGAHDDAGRALDGAVGEARALGRRYRDATVRVVEAAAPAPPAAADLARFDVLHVAAHAEADDRRPWNSGVFLARGAGGEAWLRAGAIAGQPLQARLAVLSGCSSAHGRTLSGEGVQGLTTAFLSAGVPSVVATLWPVSDRVTARFMNAFYARLERGADAATALAAAQRSLRSERATAAPFYWAGFVLVGDPATRVDLARRPQVLPALALALAFLPLGVVLARRLAARNRSRVIPAPPGTPSP